MGKESFLSLLIRGMGSLMAWLFVGLATLFFFFPIFFLFLFHFWVDPDRRKIHGLASVWAKGLIGLSGARVRVFGRENLPRGRPFLLLANHQSYADIPVLYFLRNHFKWMADEALFQIPVFGWIMRMAGYVSVRRGDPRKGIKALERAKGWLGKGVPIFVFPEGTRSHTGALGRFQTGGFRLAVTTMKPVVPIVVLGTRQFLPRGGWLIRFGMKIQIHVLPAVTPSSDSAREVKLLVRKVKAQMAQEYRRHLRQVR